jgi:ribosome-binding factor A
MVRKSSRPSPSQGRSQRQLRVGEEIRHILAGILMRGELRDPGLSGVSVTVSEVRVSPDLKNATAFAMPLGGGEIEPVLEALNRTAPHLRSQVAKVLQLRHAPSLTFVADRSFDEAHHIEELLRSERVARDLRPAGDASRTDDGDDGETQG